MTLSVSRDWITVREACEVLSVRPRTLQRACTRGLLVAEQVGGTWLISRASFNEAVQQGSLRDAPALRPELRELTRDGKPRTRRAALRGVSNTTNAA